MTAQRILEDSLRSENELSAAGQVSEDEIGDGIRFKESPC